MGLAPVVARVVSYLQHIVMYEAGQQNHTQWNCFGLFLWFGTWKYSQRGVTGNHIEREHTSRPNIVNQSTEAQTDRLLLSVSHLQLKPESIETCFYLWTDADNDWKRRPRRDADEEWRCVECSGQFLANTLGLTKYRDGSLSLHFYSYLIPIYNAFTGNPLLNPILIHRSPT